MYLKRLESQPPSTLRFLDSGEAVLLVGASNDMEVLPYDTSERLEA